MELRIDHVSKAYGGQAVLRDVTAAVGSGVTCLMAPSTPFPLLDPLISILLTLGAQLLDSSLCGHRKRTTWKRPGWGGGEGAEPGK